jgi:hypothetical protein
VHCLREWPRGQTETESGFVASGNVVAPPNNPPQHPSWGDCSTCPGGVAFRNSAKSGIVLRPGEGCISVNASLQGIEKVLVPIAVPMWLTGASILLPWPCPLAGLKRALSIDGLPGAYGPLFFFFMWLNENVWGRHRTRLYRLVFRR